MRRVVAAVATVGVAVLAVFVTSPAARADSDCSDYPNQAAAQARLREDPSDPDGLDGEPGRNPNEFGVACTSRPCPCDVNSVYPNDIIQPDGSITPRALPAAPTRTPTTVTAPVEVPGVGSTETTVVPSTAPTPTDQVAIGVDAADDPRSEFQTGIAVGVALFAAYVVFVIRRWVPLGAATWGHLPGDP
jgi:hypothetical protein